MSPPKAHTCDVPTSDALQNKCSCIVSAREINKLAQKKIIFYSVRDTFSLGKFILFPVFRFTRATDSLIRKTSSYCDAF